ncbi:hypothetical protein VF21_09168 [Pseudogymnoascus sp. 05NY08]|nr:hypothetical protein VF21_09168 [Pseudogymnoascus sp. 05NY08]
MMGKDFEAANVTQIQEVNDAKNLRESLPSAFQTPNGNSGQLDAAIPIEIAYQDNRFFRVLVDPIFQGLGPVTRYYLDYYANILCVQAVLYDISGNNPFRGLMAMIRSSPLILNCILATSASHATNYLYPSFFLSDTNSPLAVPCSSTGIQPVPKPSFYYALLYKQRVLTQLRKDIQDPAGLHGDLVIAPIALLVWIEMIESGKDTWRIHLNGLKRLTEMRDEGIANEIGGSRDASSPSPLVHSYFFDTCIIIDIMGTTLAQPYKISRPIFPSAISLNYLRRSEKMSFLGCPADLLYLILAVNWQCWLKAQTAAAVTTSPLQPPISETELSFATPTAMGANSIINEILTFDPVSWSLKTSTTATAYSQSDLYKRTRLACAYKSAVFIYAMRVLRPENPAHHPAVSIAQLADQVIADIRTIPTHDPLFKCLVWPTFISGAETWGPAQRDVVRGLLRDLWLELRSENIANAAGVLEGIWYRADREEEEAEAGKGEEGARDGRWTDHLAREGVDWLFL